MKQQIYNKYGGHCAYCGAELNYKTFHIDHIIPKKLNWIYNKRQKTYSFDKVIYLEQEYAGKILRLKNINDERNLMPACPQCNMIKGTYQLRVFKEILQKKGIIKDKFYYEESK